MDNEDVGKPVSDYFGVAGDAPRVSFPHSFFFFKSDICSRIQFIQTKFWRLFTYMQVLAYTGNEDGKKFVLDGALTSQSIKVRKCFFLSFCVLFGN